MDQNDALSSRLHLQGLRCDAEVWKVWETTETQQQAPPPEGEVLQYAGAEDDRHPTADPTYKTRCMLTWGACKKWGKGGIPQDHARAFACPLGGVLCTLAVASRTAKHTAGFP